MASIPEQRLSRSLRAILADLPVGASLPDSEQYREVLTDLQYFIPTCRTAPGGGSFLANDGRDLGRPESS
jgi:hypothetical protein